MVPDAMDSLAQNHPFWLLRTSEHVWDLLQQNDSAELSDAVFSLKPSNKNQPHLVQQECHLSANQLCGHDARVVSFEEA